MKQKVIRIAVVGAGAGGLCSLRYFASRQSLKNPNIHFKAVAYEQTSRVGGTWVYTDQTGTDEWGKPIHSSMYKNLKTNLPKEVMAYPDHPFPKNLPSFIDHVDVLNYLEDYATHFDLWKHIKFERFVEQVAPMYNSEKQFGTQWEVTTVNAKSNDDKTKEIFDAVLICNGHYSNPVYPEIPGLNTYKGNLIHSHNYREPSPYKDQTVVVLGAGSSGQDIAMEVSSVAKQVYLSHNNNRLATILPSNMEQKPGIKHIHLNVLEFSDGSALEVDSVILATGYYFNFDFLSEDVDVKVEDGRITPLYKHLLHCRFPNLAFVGMPKVVVPLLLMDVQNRFFRSILEGSCTLPSAKEMIDDTELEYQARREEGLPHRYAHFMGIKQFAYYSDLLKLAGMEPLPKYIENMYKTCSVLRRSDILHYRNNDFILEDNGEFKIVERSPGHVTEEC